MRHNATCWVWCVEDNKWMSLHGLGSSESRAVVRLTKEKIANPHLASTVIHTSEGEIVYGPKPTEVPPQVAAGHDF